MTEAEIKRFQTRARILIRKKGLPHLADDFAQYVILRFLENPKCRTNLFHLFVEFMRTIHGTRGTPKGDAMFKALNGQMPLHELKKPIDASQGDFILNPRIKLTPREKELIEYVLIRGFQNNWIAAKWNVSTPVVCVMLKTLMGKLRRYFSSER